MKLGYINYLNLLPLYYGLETGRTVWDGELVTGPPTHVNALFYRGQADVSPISSIQYARGPESDLLLPGLSITALGPVQSILLFSRRRPEDLTGGVVALTASSATSVVLTKILLRRYWQVAVTYRIEPPDLDAMLAVADAALLIGDDALRAGLSANWCGEALRVTDLGAVWRDFTGLPMVYAVFAAHPAAVPDVPATLDVLARSRWVAARDPAGLVERGAATRGLPLHLVDIYLNRIIRHDFAEAEQAGLLRFYQEAASIGELAVVPDLRFIKT
ncbi:MAG: menaquinone biosynthetic enzyme MqnA/MqnD family protein [Symbiobacteriia bacterium]